ncbi:Receptor-type tyrosine-protein phosphatase epsilon [Blattella germanica]|nr:Receptor-type tyrosine-protein phosphatase epsilon [Blattella germanica]
MVWQENVQVIAMMTNLFESGKLKCDKYWPDLGHEVTYGAISVLTASNQIFADYTFRILNVSSKGKTRKIHQLHFTSWPDHRVPLYTQSVASYLKKLLAVYPGSGPIVVHCSAGVGRTGTIILTDICLRMAAAEGCVDVLSFQQHIREQRANMVDNLEQYKLVHLVLLECLVLEPSSYPYDANFEKLVQELSTSGAIESQFKRLLKRNWQDLALREFSQDQVSQTATFKNRNLNIVPSSHGQVHISSYPANIKHSNYINAVYVDGFRAKDQFVVTQFPLQSTVGDFWRLIHEKNISLIVVLNEIDDEEDKSVFMFWPQELGKSLKPVPYITLTKKTEDDSTQWKTHSLSVNTTQSAVSVNNFLINPNPTAQEYRGPTESTTVRVLHLKGWKAQDQLPPSPDVIIELWQEAERLYKGKQPMVVCCLNGATASGFFVALAFLIEKIKLEQQCDVCQAVRTVRQNREQFVPTCEQFQCLYNAAVSYLDSFQTYANFN